MNSYYDIKKLIPDIKEKFPWLESASSQVLQESAKSHAASTKSWKTKKAKISKMTGKETKDAGTANHPGFKSRKFFQTHKYQQRGISFEIEGAKLEVGLWLQPRRLDHSHFAQRDTPGCRKGCHNLL